MIRRVRLALILGSMLLAIAPLAPAQDDAGPGEIAPTEQPREAPGALDEPPVTPGDHPEPPARRDVEPGRPPLPDAPPGGVLPDGQERPGPGRPGGSRAPRGDVPPDADWPTVRGEEIQVERPDEIARIQGELERIQRERARVSAEGALGLEEARVREFSADELTPVLQPREQVVHLSLQEAIGEALANNPDYLIQLLVARATAEQVPIERGVFDPILSSRASYTEARQPAQFNGGLSVLPTQAWSVDTGLAWRLPTGTQLGLTWTEARRETQNPFVVTGTRALTPQLQFTVSQPLLRGFGLDVNLAPLEIAKNQALSSDAELATTYMSAVLAIEDAYWGLVRAEEELRFQERSLSSALQFLADQRKREEHGAGTKLEVTIAKAGVAQRREAVIIAENALESARDQIIRLTRPSSDAGKWDLFVVPVDLPRLVPEPTLDPAAAIQAALARRPDYWQGLLALDTARRSLRVAENGVLPQLNAFGTWQQDGLGRGHHSAWTAMGSGRFYTWTVGLELELPLFLRSERARLRQARLDVERAEANLHALEATVVLEVRRAIRDIRTSKARIEASRANRILAEERLKATRDMLEAGAAVPRDVLDDLADLAAAESAEIQAFITYRLSITRLRRVQGNILDGWLEVLPRRVRRALQREPLD